MSFSCLLIKFSFAVWKSYCFEIAIFAIWTLYCFEIAIFAIWTYAILISWRKLTEIIPSVSQQNLLRADCSSEHITKV